MKKMGFNGPFYTFFTFNGLNFTLTLNKVSIMLHKRLFIFSISLLCVFSHAQQGNYKFSNYGNRSILLSGNVTGSVEDLGVTYYNPARLILLENTGFAFNAKAFQINSTKITNIAGEESKVSKSDFDGIPAMAGGTFSLFNERFAYSFISKSRLDLNINYSTSEPNSNVDKAFPDLQAYKSNINLFTKLKDEWIGLTWAKKLNDKLSVGVSMFGSIYQYQGDADLNYTLQSTSNKVSSIQYSNGFSQDSYGLLFKIGTNYHFEKFDLGININVPYLEIYKDASFNYNYVVAGFDDADQFYDYDLKNLSSNRKEPLGVSLGAGVPIGKSKLHLNADYVSGISKYHRIEIPDIDIGDEQPTAILFDERRFTVFNFGAGADVYINEKFKAFLGLSSDYSAYGSNANIFDLSSDETKDINVGEDFFHWSLGVDWNLNWASFVLGTTYTSGSSSFKNPLNIGDDGIDFDDTVTSKIKFTRWQFVVGIEVPFLDSKTTKSQ